MLYRICCDSLYGIGDKVSNKMSLEAAVDAAASFLNKCVKPVLIVGPKMRVAKAGQAFVELADSSGYAVATMPAGKGHFPEDHPHFIGTYWGAVSSQFTSEICESSDCYLFAGPIFNDYRLRLNLTNMHILVNVSFCELSV